MTSPLSQIVRRWIVWAFVSTILIAFSYVGIQQSYRNGANDPQVQLAEDVAAALDAGATSADIVPTSTVDIAKSLSSYIFIFDKDNKLLGSDVTLNGKAPNFPVGVLDTARKNGTDIVTWQPEAGVRSAVVATKSAAGDVVVVGRSLREVEKRIAQLTYMAAGAWGIALIGSFLLLWTMDGMMLRKPKMNPIPAIAPEPVVPPHQDETHP